MSMLPKLKESFKVLSNIPDKKEDLFKAFEKLGVKYEERKINIISLLSVAFNEKWIDTVNLPISAIHKKIRDIHVQLPIAKEIASLKSQKKQIEEDFVKIGKKEERKKAMEETKESYQQVKRYDQKIAEAKNDDDVSCYPLLYSIAG